MIDVAVHPVIMAYYLVDRYGEDLTLSFSRYFYRPQSVFDQREQFSVSVLEVTPEWVARQIASLAPGWELAINSSVVDKRGRMLHMPMIDFVASDMGFAKSSAFNELIGRDITRSFVYFNSGRSLHAYSATLLSRPEWRRYMAKLLLLNLPGEPPIIDSRWVGHRLLNGYAALRWSKNTDHYPSLPVRMQVNPAKGSE